VALDSQSNPVMEMTKYNNDVVGLVALISFGLRLCLFHVSISQFTIPRIPTKPAL
jgi:hypothetical protein